MTVELVVDKKSGQNIWFLQGDLTVFSLSTSNKAKHWMQQFPKDSKDGRWVVSGEKISKIDTAGLAFLLESLAHAKKYHIEISFSSLPKEVVPLMNAQGVGELITAHVDQQ
jgi:ABC-type transporter Mla MlaB component